LCIYLCIYVFIYVFMYLFIYKYIYVEMFLFFYYILFSQYKNDECEEKGNKDDFFNFISKIKTIKKKLNK